MDNQLSNQIQKRAEDFAKNAKREALKSIINHLNSLKATPDKKPLLKFREDLCDILEIILITIKSNKELNYAVTPNPKTPTTLLVTTIKGEYIDTILNSIPAMQTLLDIKNQTNEEING